MWGPDATYLIHSSVFLDCQWKGQICGQFKEVELGAIQRYPEN